MDTEKYILAKDVENVLDNIKVANIDEKELKLIEIYVEVGRYIQESEQLFHIFNFNLKNLLYLYELRNNDIIKYRGNYDFEKTDCVKINALTINFLSSGKTLVESLETFAKSLFGETSTEYLKLKRDCIEAFYNNKFYYRFLHHIRNFSQHGHLPVVVDDNKRCSFDINSMLGKPHFKWNSALKDELEETRQIIYDKYLDYPKIVFTRALAEYNLIVIKIYVEFINIIETVLVENVQKIKKLLKSKPELIHQSLDCFNGFVFYKEDENVVHCFNSNEDTMQLLLNIKAMVEDIYRKEDIKLKKLVSPK